MLTSAVASLYPARSAVSKARKAARTSVSAVAVAMPPGENKDNGEAMRDADGPLEPGSLRTHTLAFSNTITN